MGEGCGLLEEIYRSEKDGSINDEVVATISELEMVDMELECIVTGKNDETRELVEISEPKIFQVSNSHQYSALFMFG